jgi:alpha-galactosidase
VRRARLEALAQGGPVELVHSDETLAPVIAALAGGPTGRFVVNTPNVAQIDDLPRNAVVESAAEVDALGVRPIAVGALPHPVYAALAPHVAWQELVVEAALTGRREPARAAMAIDLVVHDPAIVDHGVDELVAANAPFVESAVGDPGRRTAAGRS